MSMLLRRRTALSVLAVLGVFLVGTVVVLSTISYYLAIHPRAFLTEQEVPVLDSTTRWNASDHGQVERIPRILHQTWKTETLPVRWQKISRECREMMPDYEYMLWTDKSSREFLEEHYPWFLDTFDEYTYPIQRADAIRYFVLHHYGGVYIDLDVGCLRPLDPLLVFPVILPKTIPVGVSNDIMFAEKNHPFFAQTIHNLVTFDHSWILNYPTVMFSTGPMFLSAQYGLYSSSHLVGSGDEVRILPKSMYGKNAEGHAPHSFFSHWYGSSWHADDAGFIGFLGSWGKTLMWIGLFILIVGLYKLLTARKPRRYGVRRIGGYEVVLPRWSHRGGRWHIDMGRFNVPSSASQPTSPTSETPPGSPLDDDFIPYDSRPPSPTSSEYSDAGPSRSSSSTNPIRDAVQWAKDNVMNVVDPTGVMYFLPAIFTHYPTDLELSTSLRSPHNHAPGRSRGSTLLPRYREDAAPPPSTLGNVFTAEPVAAAASSSRSGPGSENPHALLIDLSEPGAKAAAH